MAAIQRIEGVHQLDALLERSKQQPVWIFKHSLTCSISSRAWTEFRRFVETQPEHEAVFTLVEVQTARAVSNAVAERTGIRHESPQAILLRDAAAAFHASHSSIHRATLEMWTGRGSSPASPD
jgi:bacillithiol system protein YtxJ